MQKYYGNILLKDKVIFCCPQCKRKLNSLVPITAIEPTYKSSILFCMCFIKKILKDVQIFILVAQFCHKLQFCKCVYWPNCEGVKTIRRLAKEIHKHRIITEIDVPEKVMRMVWKLVARLKVAKELSLCNFATFIYIFTIITGIYRA